VYDPRFDQFDASTTTTTTHDDAYRSSPFFQEDQARRGVGSSRRSQTRRQGSSEQFARRSSPAASGGGNDGGDGSSSSSDEGEGFSDFEDHKSRLFGEQRSKSSYIRAAHNRAQHEAQKAEYRQRMQKPIVRDKKLQKFISKLYRPTATVGSGSTADAIREEKATGQKIKNSFHIKKGEDALVYLKRWLINNPTASPGDRAAVENIIDDLNDALGYMPRPTSFFY